MSEKFNIPAASCPEEVGVDSKCLQGFIDEALSHNKEFHSMIVIRHGKVACEVYREPFNANSKHMVYSVSKSFTSTAIGFAIDEGYLDYDTKFLDIFPEYRNEKKPDENLELLTVENLLTMRSGKSVSPLTDKSHKDWLKDFVKAPWYAKPGEEFLYINENMYVLCAMISRTTGMSVTEFLTPRLYKPLGIEVPYWETCPKGIEAGGWGLMLTSRDLARFTFCYQQDGKFAGKQVLPKGWVKKASQKHADSSNSVKADSSVGYGYCFWRCEGCENAYRADGMFSQFGIVFEDQDACLILTSGELDAQAYRNIMWKYFPKAFNDNCDPADTVEVKAAPYPKPEVKPRSYDFEKKIECKRISLAKPVIVNVIGYPVSSVTLPALYMEKDKAGNIDNVGFKFSENEGRMSWTEGDEINSITFGLDGEYRWDYMWIGGAKYQTCSFGIWRTPQILEIHLRAMEAVFERILTFVFNKNVTKVQLKPSSFPPLQSIVENLGKTVQEVIPNPAISGALIKVLPKLTSIADSKQYGTLKQK